MRFALLAVFAPAMLSAQAPALTPGQMKQDLDWFRANVFGVEQSYTPATRSEAERRLSALEAAIPRTSPIAFEMEIARIVALADNGHSNVFAFSRSRWSNHIPLRFTTFGDEFRVMRASPAHADLLGARLTAVDVIPVAAIRDSGRTLFGGVPAWRDRTLPKFLESPDQLYVLGIARSAKAADYSFVTDAGKTITTRLVAGMGDSGGPQPDVLLYGERDPGWSSVTPTPSWSLQDPETSFRWRPAPELGGLVIQMRRIVDGPGQSILAFLDSMKTKIAADHPRNVVIDLRMNGGGNLNNARDFVKTLPGMVPGRVFVITGPGTFSAAISTTGYLKQAAPERVTIVGEEAGDRLVFFAEGRPGSAPNSGMVIGIATQRHDYRGGCKAFTDCHGPVIRFPIAIPTLAPDLPAPLTFADWKAGRDPAIEAITRAVRR